MVQSTHVEETLFSASHPQLYKHISVHQILVSSLMAIGGIVGILLSVVLNEGESTLCMALLAIGIILLVFSCYRFFTKRYETVYKSTGSIVCSGTLYMDTAEMESLQRMMLEHHFSSSFRLSLKEAGNGRLDYLKSKDGKFMAVQLFRYVPYTYEPVSGVFYYIDNDAIAFARCMNI